MDLIFSSRFFSISSSAVSIEEASESNFGRSNIYMESEIMKSCKIIAMRSTLQTAIPKGLNIRLEMAHTFKQ